MTELELKQKMNWGNSYERLGLLLDAESLVSRQVFFNVLGEEWGGFDNIRQYKVELKRVFRRASQLELDSMMSEDDRRAYKALPNVVTVYRGCYPFNRDGLSWTTCREVAEKFTTLNRYSQKGLTSSVIKATVKKTGLVYKGDRSEFEMIIPRKLKWEVI